MSVLLEGIMFVLMLEISLAFRNMWTITPNRGIKWNVPTNPYKMDVRNCSYIDVNGFLKMRCFIENEEYFKCSNSYRFYRVTQSSCQETSFSRVCPNDTTFYQACGHGLDLCKKSVIVETVSSFQNSAFGSDVAACGALVCKHFLTERNDLNFYGNPVWLEDFYATSNQRTGTTISSGGLDFECSDYPICANEIDGLGVDKFACDRFTELDNDEDKVESFIECDNICKSKVDCSDEANCNNLTLGMFCYQPGYEDIRYVHPYQICDSNPNCKNQADEIGCENFSEVCLSENVWLLSLRAVRENTIINDEPVLRHLSPRSKCAVIPAARAHLVCADYRDQMNCTGSTISPLICQVNGYPTSISEHVICKQLGRLMDSLCDDKIDQECVELETGCKIHRHKLCDGSEDCLKGLDEGDLFCQEMFTFSNYECVRRFSYNTTKSKIPSKWVLDGVSDCRSDEDENPEVWTKLCGYGLLDLYLHGVNVFSDCEGVTQLKCPQGQGRMNIDRVCSGKGIVNCDFEVCITARKEYLVGINDKLEDEKTESGVKRTFFCLPGLHEIEMYAGKCLVEKFLERPSVMGIPDVSVLTSLTFARNYVECGQIFGELYVYLACIGLCKESVSECPIKPNIVTCSNYPARKTVFSLAENGKLAMAISFSDGISYSQEFFPCQNGRCTTFDRVCNLANDCGDFSDEKGCLNNFKCEESGELIPLTSKCDGNFDCFDYSDECNGECTNQITMFNHIAYNVLAWIFGLFATLLNLFTLFHGIYEYRKLKSETAKVNKAFVLLITFGDLLQGIFLLVLSIGEQFFNNSTCKTQFNWTTSSLCTFLGVFSTIGSLVSLYSMTVLSIIRASKVRSLLPPKDSLSRNRAAQLFAALFGITAVAVIIAIFPIISFEDYFVENLQYEDNPLLVGAPNKIKHLTIVESYYGRVYGSSSRTFMTWAKIRYLVRDLFANSVVTGKSLDFYGSNGFCLFSYFVRSETSFRWFSISILILNFICVLVIVICYIIITTVSLKSSESVSKNEQSMKNNKKLQRKITIIITTDILTWLPFMIVCIVNYTELVDTSSWYSLFCVFFLRINSIINPIGIYDETIFEWIKLVKGKLAAKMANVRGA